MSTEVGFRIRCDVCGVAANYNYSASLDTAMQYAVEYGWQVPAVLDQTGRDRSDVCPYCQRGEGAD